MSLYEVTEAGLNGFPVADFAELGLYERSDLQWLLRDYISARVKICMPSPRSPDNGGTLGDRSTSAPSTGSDV